MLLSELYIKSVYLNLFGWRGREVHETFEGDASYRERLFYTHRLTCAAAFPLTGYKQRQACLLHVEFSFLVFYSSQWLSWT
jgi:hypothetical protein